MDGVVEIVSDSDKIKHATDCMLKRFPQLAEWVKTGQGSDTLFLKIAPQIGSVLNYEKGFGHTDLVTV